MNPYLILTEWRGQGDNPQPSHEAFTKSQTGEPPLSTTVLSEDVITNCILPFILPPARIANMEKNKTSFSTLVWEEHFKSRFPQCALKTMSFDPTELTLTQLEKELIPYNETKACDTLIFFNDSLYFYEQKRKKLSVLSNSNPQQLEQIKGLSFGNDCRIATEDELKQIKKLHPDLQNRMYYEKEIKKPKEPYKDAFFRLQQQLISDIEDKPNRLIDTFNNLPDQEKNDINFILEALKDKKWAFLYLRHSILKNNKVFMEELLKNNQWASLTVRYTDDQDVMLACLKHGRKIAYTLIPEDKTNDYHFMKAAIRQDKTAAQFFISNDLRKNKTFRRECNISKSGLLLNLILKLWGLMLFELALTISIMAVSYTMLFGFIAVGLPVMGLISTGIGVLALLTIGVLGFFLPIKIVKNGFKPYLGMAKEIAEDCSFLSDENDQHRGHDSLEIDSMTVDVIEAAKTWVTNMR